MGYAIAPRYMSKAEQGAADAAMTTDYIRSIVEFYCASRSDILEVWLFGSRAENRQRENSDIDLFFELDPVFQKANWSVLSDWHDDKNRILAGLTCKFSVDVHVVPAYPGMETGGVRKKAHTGILIYRRTG